MKTLVVGSGGREHALAWKLAQETEVICAPGNPGIAEDAETAAIKATDTPGLVKLARDRQIDLVVVGPEDPLILGLADAMREAGIATYGPGAAGARLEGSKAFSKEVMANAGVPTAEFVAFDDFAAAAAYVDASYAEGRQLAVKASGAALGRGVVVAETRDQAREALERMMVHREFGASGETVVLEELMIGREFSLLTIIGDQNFVSLPVSQDYKRVFDGDLGPNTGGMGTYSPCAWVSEADVAEIERTMVVPILDYLRKEGIPYRGTLYTGVMVTDRGARCLEYNVRLGDPETQTVMMRLETGLAAAFNQSAIGAVIEAPTVSDDAVVTVVVGCEGYPTNYAKGNPVTIGKLPDSAKLFFAGVGPGENGMVTTGGRVAGASARAKTLTQARTAAYTAAATVQFEGAMYRKDIGIE